MDDAKGWAEDKVDKANEQVLTIAASTAIAGAVIAWMVL